MKRFLLGAVLALLAPTAVTAFNNRPIIQKLESMLPAAKSRKDSIRIYYDILDLSPKTDYFKIGKALDPLLAREGDVDSRFEVARLMAVATSNDTVLESIQKYVDRLPASTDKKETQLFVSMKRTANSAFRISEKERQAIIDKVVASNNFDRLDKYGKINELFTYMLHLGSYADSKLLAQCIADLDKMIAEAGFNSYALQSLFNSSCSAVYTTSGNAQMAVANDRKVLALLDQKEREYRIERGRKYRNYEWDRFAIYGRMLFNYEALSQKEVNDIYARILKMAQGNAEITGLLENAPAITAYYHYKNGRYAEAIPYLKKQLAIEGKVTGRKSMLRELSYAAQVTGDSITKRIADQEYAQIMDEYRVSHAQEKYNDLRMKYQYNVLKNDNARLELKQKEEHINTMHNNMIVMMVGWIVLAGVLAVALIYWVRYRRLSSNMQDFVDSLARERDVLKRAVYHHYEKPQSGGEVVKPVRSTRHDIKKVPMEKLQDYVMNDVMYVASLVAGDSEEFIKTVGCREMFSLLRSEIHTGDKGVKLIIEDPAQDFDLHTDILCLEYVQKHIVKVAVDLSAPGDVVKLWCEPDPANGCVKFICTHEGKVFPPGREELVFRNLLSYQNIERNDSAARIIIRMISFLMHNPLRITRNDDHGARCELTISLK